MDKCHHPLRAVSRRHFFSPSKVYMVETKVVCEACKKVTSVYVKEVEIH